MAAVAIQFPQPTFYKANWDASNILLKPRTELCHKIKKIFWRILSILIPILGLVCWLVNKYAAEKILPSAFYKEAVKLHFRGEHKAFWHGPITNESRKFRGHFTATEHTIKTPDEAELAVTHFQHRDADPFTPTILCFQPNGTMKNMQTYRWLQEASINKEIPANFVIFDYRGVGDSKGKFQKTNDLLIDGSSVVQWLQHEKGVGNDQIEYYGMSLGGAVSICTQALNPLHTGANGNERSFASISEMIHDIGAGTPLKCLSGLVAWVVRQEGFELDPSSKFSKVAGKKLVAFHVNDSIIPYAPSLAKAVENRHAHDRVQLTGVGSLNHHNEPIEYYSMNNTQENAASRIADFMLRRV